MAVSDGPSARETQAPSTWERLRFPVAVLVVALVHLALMAYFNVGLLWSDHPYAGHDFDTHIHQTWRVLEGLEGWGKSWVYDPGLLIGYPHGVIFDADNKGWEIWTWWGTKLGLSRGFAFNTFVLAAHVTIPFVVYGSSRLFGLDRETALAAASCGIAFWFFDSWSHWCWWIGMVAYGWAGCFFLLPLALFYRYLEGRNLVWAGLAALTMGVAHTLHPYTFFMLVVPMLALYVRSFRDLKGWEHAVVVGIAVATVLTNLWWLRVAFSFWHYIQDSAYFGQGGLAYLPADFFGILIDSSSSGLIGTRTAFRVLFLIVCVVQLLRWRRQDDPRFVPFAWGVGAMFLLTYVGTYTPAAQIQPYRHVQPMGFLSVIPAGVLLRTWVRERPWKDWTPQLRVALLVGAVLASQQLARDVLYFGGASFRQTSKTASGRDFPMTQLGAGPFPDYRYQDYEVPEIVAWVRRVDRKSGRFLVEGPLLGEHLAWKTNAAILGGFTERNLGHAYANLFRISDQGRVSSRELDRYVRTYAVHWVVVETPDFLAPWWDEHEDVLERVGQFKTTRVYRVRRPTQLVRNGGGKARATTNKIEVNGSDPRTDVVLRFHWMEQLRCAPDCEIVRWELPGNKVGLIKVPAPHPADFTIENAY